MDDASCHCQYHCDLKARRTNQKESNTTKDKGKTTSPPARPSRQRRLLRRSRHFTRTQTVLPVRASRSFRRSCPKRRRRMSGAAIMKSIGGSPTSVVCCVRRPTATTSWRWNAAAAHSKEALPAGAGVALPSPPWTRSRTWSTTSVPTPLASWFLPRPQRHTISFGGCPPMFGGDVCLERIPGEAWCAGWCAHPCTRIRVARCSGLDASVRSFIGGETTPILIGTLTMCVLTATAPSVAEA